jgi:periplasmic protein TonB
MFNNLIESSSHAKEFKRRGSFLLFTTVSYLVLFSFAGVASIYAYDAHLEKQSTELELIGMVPVEQPPQPASQPPRKEPIVTTTDPSPTRSTRIDLISRTDDPTRVPQNVGVIAPNIPPANPNSVRDTYNSDPAIPSGVRGVPGGTGTVPTVDMPEPPPAAVVTPTPTPIKVLRISRVLNSEAISLPKPIYPAIARQVRQQGTVTVRVLINESGNVIKAEALSGPALLVPEAKKAAMQARFSPTRISDQPVQVSGVITYNFVLN